MAISKKKREELRGKSVFPDTRTVAEFHFCSQTITLDEIDRTQFEGLTNPSEFGASRSVAQTIFHELTHWADLTGTLWGRRFIQDIYELFPLLDRLDDEDAIDDFWRFVSLHDQDRRLMHPAYYRVREGDGRLGVPTSNVVDFSCGMEFDPSGRPDPNRPLIFVRFRRSEGNLFVRQPLTVGALIETTAVWSEISTGLEIASSLGGDVARVENKLIEDDVFTLLDDPDLTIYTAPVRMLSNMSSISEYIFAYNLAASLSFICLNLSPEHFQQLQEPDRMQGWGDRNKALKANCDPAFAFTAICIAAGTFDEADNVEVWIDRGLTKCNLPSSEIVRAAAIAEMERSPTLEPSKWSQSGQYILHAGLETARMRAETEDAALTLGKAAEHKLPLPPLFAQLEVGRMIFSTFDYEAFDSEAMFELEYQLENAVRNFLPSCR